ncbi:hypothetical protein [Intrasporangium flavum]|uniref:hypothetical protein n=1 Tax=Intrasporangium flavum TaxID=1428657 RepID=UPI00096C81B6|nr:hypothetical protein [Intrasporangium flavum]
MSDDPTRRTGPDPEPGPPAAPTPEPGELQLRKALAMTNDLEPPRDDLFAQRALMRGRARTARRRNAVLGSAAAVVLVGVVGAGWALSGGQNASSTSAGSAAGAPERMSDKGTDAGAPGIAPDATGSLGSGSGPSLQGTQVPPARDTSEFFGTLHTPATRAFDAVSTTVTTRWPDVFSGAYADDPTGSSVVVAVTRHDPSLESFVTGAMPAGSVRFVAATHTWDEKVQVAQQVRDDAPVLKAQGVLVHGVGIDARGDRVVVSADERSAPGTLEQRYGDVVRVVATTASVPGKLPDGGTLPTLQH